MQRRNQVQEQSERFKEESEQRKRAREAETEVAVTRHLTNFGDESDEDEA